MKILSLLIVLVFPILLSPQEILHSQDNILRFADHLFRSQDYLRAIEEYKKIKDFNTNDSILFKIACSNVFMGHYEDATHSLSLIPENSRFSGLVAFLNLRNSYSQLDRTDDYFGERKPLPIVITDIPTASPGIRLSLSRLNFFWKMKAAPDPGLLNQINIFENEDRDTISSLVNSVLAPPLKSSLLAGTMSTLVPGLGKLYIDRPEDAFIAFALTVASGYIAYTSFEAGHKVRGWIFGGLGGLFYLGNIYGTITGTEQYNIRIKVGITDLIDSFVRDKNFFSPSALTDLLR